MKPKAICYFTIMLLITGMIACGGDDPEPESTATEQPTTSSSQPAEATPTLGRDIDFAAEEQAIRELYAVYAAAHGAKDEDTLTEVWLLGESKDIFTAWTFWAGTFEKNEGAKAVSKAWAGIFRLRGGKMAVDITYIAIDGRGKEAVLRGKYDWGNQKGDLISALRKDGKDWKIRAIDYTDGRFGKQVKDMADPAYTFGEIAEE